MWDSEDVVEAQKLSSDPCQQQAGVLQCTSEEEQQVFISGESPCNLWLSVLGREEEEEEEEREDESEEAQCSVTSAGNSLPVVEAVSMETNEQADPNAGCQATEVEHTGDLQQDSGSISHSPDPEADIDPDYDLDVDPQGLCLFPCQHCERRFSTKQGLERHTHIHASAACQAHTFKCRHCGKSFGSQFGCRRHERRHENAKKRPGSLTGTIASLRPPLQTDSGSTDAVSPSGKGAQMGNPALESTESAKRAVLADTADVGLDENREFKGPHVCKYCKKVFGTHTNLRRHQRRIHERKLLPKGACGKGTPPLESQPEKQQPAPTSQESPTVSPSAIYLEEEGEPQEEYMVDISSNISENLSFYIDGKIVSTSVISNCEVIEVNSGTATVIGLDALIISPAQITQALKIETATCTVTEIPGQALAKRRTATPPLLPQIKTELESESILATSSSSSPSSSSSSLSSSSVSLLGTLFPQPIESLAFQKEKTVYLSPKLKQLLQTQDGSKPTFALITDGQKLGPPLSLTVLPAGSGRFKRRTASPPNSPQQSPVLKVENVTSEAGVSSAPKVPKLESHCSSPASSLSSKDERDTLSSPGMDSVVIHQVLPLDWSPSRTGGSSCNQQPLDLSNAVSKRDSSEALGEAVLDLSMHRKSTTESELSPQTVKKSKPNSSMLQKVLMNEYAIADVAGEEGSGDSDSLIAPFVADVAMVAAYDPDPANPERLVFQMTLPSVSYPPSPPLLTPVTMHPASPFSPVLGYLNSTPPPPVLPSASSPVIISTPPEPQPICSTAESSLPVLSPEISPSIGISTEKQLHSAECDLNVTLPNWVNSAPGGLDNIVLPANPSLDQQDPERTERTLIVDSVMVSEVQTCSPSTSVNESNVDSSSIIPNTVVIECIVSLESSENISAFQGNTVESPSGKMLLDHTEQQQPHSSSQLQTLDPAVIVASVQESVTSSSSVPSPSDVALTSPHVPAIIKEEIGNHEEPTNTSVHHSDVEISSTSPEETTAKEESSPLHPLCKNFTCNVCDKPFESMKELSGHIGEHSEEWPYKCEFCVQLFEGDTDLLEHRSSYHGIGKIYVCCTCFKEFAFLCNLQQHQTDLHPGQECSHTEVENGKLRPENHNSPTKASTTTSPVSTTVESDRSSSKVAAKDEEEDEFDNSTEELYTTIKIMASEGGKPKGPDVRLGINQRYPSFKPPPFPYHNRTPAGSLASATNFTTHNIPQTFSTAIRCTKCGKSFDNMPELHKHILSCANASDKKRYTPKKNPIPLRQFAKAQNGVLSPATAVNVRQNVSQKVGQPKRLNFQDPPAKLKPSALNKKKSQLVQKAVSQRSKSATAGRKASTPVQEELDVYVCPHCSRDFTYHASLKKHMAVSCPMKPKKSKKRKGNIPLTQENNGNVNRRTTDVIAKQQGSNHGPKARAHSSSPVDSSSLPLKSHISKGKIAAPQVRPTRPAILLTSTIHPSKKSKSVLKGNVQSQQAPKLTILSSVSSSNSPQRQGIRMQSGVKEVLRNVAEVKSPTPLPPKKEERFSMRVRERVGGPVTRSLQQATLVAPAVKADVGSSLEPGQPQEVSFKE